jgi:hypothetical protein
MEKPQPYTEKQIEEARLFYRKRKLEKLMSFEDFLNRQPKRLEYLAYKKYKLKIPETVSTND